MGSTYDDRIVETAGVLHTHEDPKARNSRKYTYLWENLRSGKSGRSHVWVFADAPGDIGKLIDSWNRRKPSDWHFELIGVARNPSRDPAYQGSFTLGHEPKRTGTFTDGDTAAVQTPHVRHPHLERDYEVWVFGMIDPRLGDTWNYVSGPMSKSAAIEEAKRLARL